MRATLGTHDPPNDKEHTMCDTERTCIECELPVDRNGDTLTDCWGESPDACPTCNACYCDGSC